MRIASRVWLVLGLVIGCGHASADETAKLATPQERLGYALGYQLAQGLKSRSVDLDAQALSRAIVDVLTGRTPALTRQEMQAVMTGYQQQLAARRELAAEKNRNEGEAFLAENRKKPGVVTLPSGVQYKVLRPGTGVTPTARDTVVANYRGTLIDGTQFDSSYDRGEPVTFPMHEVIQGWQEVLPLMKAGARWQVVVPADLAYGEHGAGGVIGPNQTLIFDIELLDVKPATDKKPR